MTLAELLGTADGTFLVRDTGKKGVYALGVVYKGKATHHKLLLDGDTGTYKVNDNGFGEHASLSSLIEHLGNPDGVKGWPVPLSTPLYAPPDAPPPSAPSTAGSGGGSAAWLKPGMSKDEAESHLSSLGNTSGTNNTYLPPPPLLYPPQYIFC